MSRQQTWIFGALLLATIGGAALVVGALFAPAPPRTPDSLPETGAPVSSSPDTDPEAGAGAEPDELARLREALADLQRTLIERDNHYHRRIAELEARIATLQSRPAVGDPVGTGMNGSVTREELLAATREAAAREIAHWKRVELVKAIKASFDAAMQSAVEAGFIEMTDANRSALSRAFDRIASPIIEGDFGNNPADWNFDSLVASVPGIVGKPGLNGRLNVNAGTFSFNGEATTLDRGTFGWRGAVAGRLTSVERHSYNVRILEAGIVKFLATWNPATVDVDMQLMRAGEEVANATGDVGGTEQLETALRPGDYQLIIFTYRDGDEHPAPVTYRISWTNVMPDSMPTGSEISGTLAAGESRIYEVDLRGGRWTLTLDGLPQELDIDVEVTGPDGDSVASGEEDAGTERVTFVAADGMHHLRVKNLSGSPATFRMRITENPE